MTQKDHIPWADIVEYVDSGEASPHFLEHLRECESCSQSHEQVRKLVGAMRIAGHPDPSGELILTTWSRIQALDSSQRDRADARDVIDSVKDKLREIWATLAPDALAPSLAVRGTTSASPRLLVYESDDYAISLSFSLKGDGRTMDILGKVIPRTSAYIPPGGHVILFEDDSEHEAELEEYGGFRFGDICRGPIRVDVEVGDYRIHLPRIEEIDDEQE
jgi:hypothetical protein